MAAPNVVVTAEDHERFTAELEAIGVEANAKLVYLIDKAGQQIATYGTVDGVDPTSLASLTAGNVAATEGVAELLGEQGFTSLFHEGASDSMHISVISDRMILLVIFDHRSSLGLVRLRVEQHQAVLAKAIEILLSRADSAAETPADEDNVFADITEADIDALFG